MPILETRLVVVVEPDEPDPTSDQISLLPIWEVFRQEREIERKGDGVKIAFLPMPLRIYCHEAETALAAAVLEFPHFRCRLAVSPLPISRRVLEYFDDGEKV